MNGFSSLLKCALSLFLGSLARGDIETDQLVVDDLDKARIRVAITDTLVSLDGTERADLGRSFTDSLIAGLLRGDRVEVIDAEAQAALKESSAPSTAPSVTPPDYVFVPTLVGQGGFYKVTVKKIAIPSGQVDAIVDETGAGSLPRMFALAERVAERLVPGAKLASTEEAPTAESPGTAESPPADAALQRNVAQSPIAMRTEQMRRPESPVAVPRPLQLAAPEQPTHRQNRVVTKVSARKALRSPEEVGRVALANAAYSFCVIDPYRGRPLQPGDRVSLKVQGWVRPTLAATVTRLERGHAIAEYSDLSSPFPPHVARGARVYRGIDPDFDASSEFHKIPKTIPAPQFNPSSF
ncbi:MAG: hypothetical protein ACR2OZ_12650 [Verrucomicrobiales bacterium]